MATENFTDNLLTVAKVLYTNSVKYLVVGGTAMAFYGRIRPTTSGDGKELDQDDFDFWFNPTFPNYMRLLQGLEDMGLDVASIKEEEFPNVKRSFLRFKLQDFTLDFLPAVANNLSFRNCYERRITSRIEGLDITVISADDLIASKATERKKDLEDIEFLKARRNQ